mmetsp:Transcript_8124/g.22178  ORF Transcript_8124/g.22178 Transcript_8124/m.22178 type:complete len:480 (+) Transcript_8124:71-1510(+)
MGAAVPTGSGGGLGDGSVLSSCCRQECERGVELLVVRMGDAFSGPQDVVPPSFGRPPRYDEGQFPEACMLSPDSVDRMLCKPHGIAQSPSSLDSSPGVDLWERAPGKFDGLAEPMQGISHVKAVDAKTQGLHDLTPWSDGVNRALSVSGDCTWLEETSRISWLDMELYDVCGNTTDFVPWSDLLAQTVQEDHEVAIRLLSPAVLQFLTGAHAERDLAEASVFSDDAAWKDSRVATALSDVVTRPRPLELLVLAMAFSYLARLGAGTGVAVGSVSARHPEVEALLLKYTCLESRSALRLELGRWCPNQACDNDSGTIPKFPAGPLVAWPSLEDGPDDAGPSLEFEVFAAFIGAHAAPRRVLQNITSRVELTDAGISGAPAAMYQLQTSLGEALGPLLAGADHIAGEAALSSRLARCVARRAAALTLHGSDLQSDACAPIDFFELHDRAAILGRLLMMHLTGDIRRWRGCAPASRRSLGGG